MMAEPAIHQPLMHPLGLEVGEEEVGEGVDVVEVEVEVVICQVVTGVRHEWWFLLLRSKSQRLFLTHQLIG